MKKAHLGQMILIYFYIAVCKPLYFSHPYLIADERLLEYDIDGILFDEQSAFQKVQIVHSKSLGNMLVLDDLQSK